MISWKFTESGRLEQIKFTVEQAEDKIRINLIKAIHAKGHTPKSLSWKTGISESAIRTYMQDGVVLTAGRLAVLCEALKTDPAQIMGLQEGDTNNYKAARKD